MRDESSRAASGPEGLRRLLRRRAAELAVEVAREGGPVPSEDLERLERLARLVELTGGEAPRRKRWPIAAVVGGTLVVVSLLLFTRVPETEVELDLELDGFEFSTPGRSLDDQVLGDSMDLLTLGIAGLEEIRIPRSRDLPAHSLEGARGGLLAIRLSRSPEGGETGISLAGLTLPAGARIRIEPLQSSPSGKRLRLSVEGAPQELSVGVDGAVRVGLAGDEGERVLQFSSPRSIVLRSGAEQLDLELGLGDDIEVLARQLLVEGLLLHRIEEHALAPERTLVRHASTVRSGTLYFESLAGEARLLRPYEALRFDSSEGEIRRVELDDDGLGVRFHGRVRGMATGSRDHPRSLMPTTLEWLQARHGLTLLWGTTLYLAGIVVSLLRWWKGSI